MSLKNLTTDGADFMGARKDWENRGNRGIFNHREHKDHKALTDYGKPGKPRNHFAAKTSKNTKTDRSGKRESTAKCAGVMASKPKLSTRAKFPKKIIIRHRARAGHPARRRGRRGNPPAWPDGRAGGGGQSSSARLTFPRRRRKPIDQQSSPLWPHIRGVGRPDSRTFERSECSWTRWTFTRFGIGVP